MDASRICQKVNDETFSLQFPKDASIQSSIKSNLTYDVDSDKVWSVLVTHPNEAKALLKIVKDYGFTMSEEDLKSLQAMCPGTWGNMKWGQFRWS